MEKEAGNKFVSTAVLWIAWGTLIFIAFLFIALIIGWLFFFEENATMLMLTVCCLIYVLLFLIAISVAFKTVKKKFPLLENVAYFKNTVVKFCLVLSGALLIFNIMPIIFLALTMTKDVIINVSEPTLLLLLLVIIASPLLMIPYCRKKIDKLYNV